MTTGLLLIDIQNDYFPGGTFELAHADKAGACAQILLQEARKRGFPVIHIQHQSIQPNATFFLPGTPGADIHHCVCPKPGEVIVQKNLPNSFRGTNLQDLLTRQGVEHLIICGMMTHMCVDSTVRAAFDLGYQCILAADACATRDLVWAGETIPADQVQGSFLAALSAVFTEVSSTNDILEKVMI
ncbi:MAG TPA: cysteine hydrolase family protein [Methanospirillum sp.]|nr:cysteine hydrolase family protein [Methanospirillum sp.]